MTQQKGDWSMEGQVATGYHEGFTVTVEINTWQEFNDAWEEKEERTDPISVDLPDDAAPDLQGYRVTCVGGHGYESEFFLVPSWTDNIRESQIEQFTNRYTPGDCRLAEINAVHETMLRIQNNGQRNPGTELLEEYNIKVTEIVDGNTWASISPRMMRGNFRGLRITVTLETPRRTASRYGEAVRARTHGTQLLLRRQHDDPDYEIREYWAMIEDESGPRLLGMIDNSPFPGITGMDVFGEVVTPGQIVWNICAHAENLPYMDEQPLPQREPARRADMEETEDEENEDVVDEPNKWQRKKNRLSATVQGHTIRVKAATWEEFQKAEAENTSPQAVPVATHYDGKMLNLMGLTIPHQPRGRAPGCICTGTRNGETSIISFTPSPRGTGPGRASIEFFQEAMTPQQFIRLHQEQRETALSLREVLKG